VISVEGSSASIPPEHPATTRTVPVTNTLVASFRIVFKMDGLLLVIAVTLVPECAYPASASLRHACVPILAGMQEGTEYVPKCGIRVKGRLKSGA
jgi:hypothetical protein